MNLPNTLTVIRVLLTFVAVILLCVHIKFFALAAFVVYCLAGSTDWFDGYIARKFGIVTIFGKFMDALSDKIMVSSMFMTLFAAGLYREWVLPALFCAIISMAREFFVSGIRMLAAARGIVMAAEKIGKYKAAFQMYSIGSIILSHSIIVDFAAEGSLMFGLSFYGGLAALAISTALSIWSGFSYASKHIGLLKE